MGLETEGSENEKGAEKDGSDVNILRFLLVSTVLLFKFRASEPQTAGQGVSGPVRSGSVRSGFKDKIDMYRF